MNDGQYVDKDLVALYDILNSATDDHEFYLEIPWADHLRILDVGCGTGTLAVAFANAGHKVTAVDPALSMIECATEREGAASVDWHCLSINDFIPSCQFDLITMTGHAFQCLHDDHEIVDFFQSIKRLLRESGRFVFETRNPDFAAWLNWNPVDSLVKLAASTGEPFEIYHQVVAVNNQFVEFRTTFKNVGAQETKVCDSKLRFTSLQELTTLTHAAGLTISKVYGDWDKSTLSNNSPAIICSVEKF